ncbi:MAG: hypothetical protein JO337_02130 [Acidimicrobiales bacterium]|nr:hypothetical protein [Acidimicrobiales bacterium]
MAISPVGTPPPTIPSTSPTNPGSTTATPTLVLNPALGPPGTIVMVTGSGFGASTPITVS